MGFADRSLIQDITYWPPASDQATNDFGNPIFSTPVLLKGRWEDRVQQIRKATGEEVISRAEVFLNADVLVSGYLVRGDYTDEEDPSAITDAWEIQAFNLTPDLRNLETEKRAYL